MRIIVPGEAKGKARPRFGNGRTYTPTPTLRAEQRIADEWRATGQTMLPNLPLELEVTLVMERPAGHWRKGGTLGAQGRRAPVPLRKPDVDNALKLVMDALNGLAYRDDVLIVKATVERRWAGPGQAPHTQIDLNAADTGEPRACAYCGRAENHPDGPRPLNADGLCAECDRELEDAA